MDSVPVPIQRQVFEKLQKLAVPLVDDASSVIERLIKHWEKTAPQSFPPTSPERQQSAVWYSSRGEVFPVGAQLRGTYLGKTYHAKITAQGIEFNGVVYDNPSSAGIAVKRAAGTKGRAASTNGWDFWEMLNPDSQRWVSIDILRSKVNG
jgi:hypothetical protein